MAYEVGVVDINLQPASSLVRPLLEFQGQVVFHSRDGIWQSDGTENGTRLIWRGEVDFGLMAVSGDHLYFRGSQGPLWDANRLWRSDGTAAGTAPVTDINPTQHDQVDNLTDVGGVLYFTANDPDYGIELYRSDGTAAGTRLVRDITPGRESTRFFDHFTNVNGTLFFVVGRELWRSDGTAAGTFSLRAFSEAAPHDLVSFNGQLHFGADDEVDGAGLWTSDGSAEGTRLKLEFNSGTFRTYPTALTVANDAIYFLGGGLQKYTGSTQTSWAVSSAGGTELAVAGDLVYFVRNEDAIWVTDGTQAGTREVRRFPPPLGPAKSDPRDLVAVGGVVYFTVYDGNNDRELWKSDGTFAGTLRVKDINSGPAPSDPTSLVAAIGRLFFMATDQRGTELWTSDGTEVGTVMVKDFSPGTDNSVPQYLRAGDSLLYFLADDGAGEGLWRSDGSAEGTFRLLPPRIYTSDFVTIGDMVYFGLGQDLWKSDGTVAGTSVFRTINNGNTPISNARRVGEFVYFLSPEAGTPMKLWRTDGTSEGTIPLISLPGHAYGKSLEIVAVDGVAYFTVNDPVTGNELWKSDGTVAGTKLVRDLFPGTPSSNPKMLTSIGGKLFFLADIPGVGTHLWVSDGTEAGTTRPGTGFNASSLRAFGDRVLFMHDTEETGRELWISDGTTAGTQLVRDITPGEEHSDLQLFFDVEGLFYFFTRLPDGSYELWTTDGSPSGTILVKPLGRPGGISASYGGRESYDGYFYFNSDDQIHGAELWRSDGTPQGTTLALDLNEGPGGSTPTQIRRVGKRLYFKGFDPAHGVELRFLDPTSNTPRVTHAVTFAGVQSQSGLTVRRNVADGSEVTHVKVTDIIRGTLFLHDGVTQVNNGDFVPFEETLQGFKFTPEAGFTGTAGFKVQSSTSASDGGLGGNVVTATITVFAALGTENDDTLTLRASTDEALLEVHRGNPPTPGATPVLVWPMDASVPLPISTLGGNDKVFVELPPNSGGPARGIRFERGAAADELQVTSGRLRLGGSVSVVASLKISAGAAIDVVDGALIVDYAGTSPVATVRETILAGRGGVGFGALWNGTGITSSKAATANAVEPEKWSLGYAENSALPLGAYTMFRGQAVDQTSVLIAYTRTGDANLDGLVNDDDVTLVGANYAPGVPNANWAMGDFDYNGFVDDDDVTLLGALYQPGAAAPLAAANYESLSTKDEVGASAGNTVGRADVHGQAIRTQNRQIAKAGNEAVRDDDPLIDLLAESIAPTLASRTDTMDGAGLPGRLARHPPDLWPL
jgi:ELWxxDGT repeat protein